MNGKVMAFAIVVGGLLIGALVLYLMIALKPIDPHGDTDDDGYADNVDAFPFNISEWKDSDSDGYGDNGDAFPTLASEHLDRDKDGVGDNADRFPTDATQQSDRDGDGYGDNPLGNQPDQFPNDSTEWMDNDSDGIGNNADFYDQGNGKIKIAISWYQDDGTDDFWTAGDPYFEIMADTNNDGIYELIKTSPVFTDKAILSNPYFVIIDLPDQTEMIKFSILVYDSDIGGNQIIDYNPSSVFTSTVHSVTAPFNGSWTSDGSNDMQNELDCELSYTISVVS